MNNLSERNTSTQLDLENVDTFVFDYGGVISFHYCEPWQGNLAQLLKTSPKEVRSLLSETSIWGRAYRLGRMTREDFWRLICDKTSAVDNDIEALEYNWANSYQIDVRMVRLMQELRDKARVKVGILSNSDHYRHRHIEETYHLSQIVDFSVSSCQHGIVKPEKEAYLKALEIANRKDTPDKVLYIDDRERNVLPAIELGMKGFTFTDYESFRDAIAKKLREKYELTTTL